jgi:ribosomal protein S5
VVSYVSRHYHIVLRHAPLIHLTTKICSLTNLLNVDSKHFYYILGKCGSVWVRLIPAPRGTGIVSAPVPKKLLMMAGIEDCYTSAKGCTGTLGNFGKT